jgi:hypothetical protein
MLNPSTADGLDDDATIRKCVGFSNRAGFGAISVVNMYAYRATKPNDMWRALKEGRAVGARNNGEIRLALKLCSSYVAAWGADPRAWDRANEVMQMLASERVVPPLVIGLTGREATLPGAYYRGPRHPLMAPYGPLLTRETCPGLSSQTWYHG